MTPFMYRHDAVYTCFAGWQFQHPFANKINLKSFYKDKYLFSVYARSLTHTDRQRMFINELFIEVHTCFFTQILFAPIVRKMLQNKIDYVYKFTLAHVHQDYFILTDWESFLREIFIEVHTYAYTQCLLHTNRHREKAKKRNIYRSLHLCLYYILIDREGF